jgi:hypothetical protein
MEYIQSKLLLQMTNGFLQDLNKDILLLILRLITLVSYKTLLFY